MDFKEYTGTNLFKSFNECRGSTQTLIVSSPKTEEQLIQCLEKGKVIANDMKIAFGEKEQNFVNQSLSRIYNQIIFLRENRLEPDLDSVYFFNSKMGPMIIDENNEFVNLTSTKTISKLGVETRTENTAFADKSVGVAVLAGIILVTLMFKRSIFPKNSINTQDKKG